MQYTPSSYPPLTSCYADNVALLDRVLRVEASFDLIKKPLKIGADEMTLYYVDGFIKDTVMTKLMMSFLALKGLTDPAEMGEMSSALLFCARALPYVETDVTGETASAVRAVLAGSAVLVGCFISAFTVGLRSKRANVTRFM